MNYLELCKKLRQEAGISGDGPATVTGQTGQLQRVVDWIRRAWIEIQNMHPDWSFMQGDFSFTATPSLTSYLPGVGGVAALVNVGEWDRNSFSIYPTVSGRTNVSRLSFMDYPTWREAYDYGVVTAGRPLVFAIRPEDGALVLGPPPDVDYTIRGRAKLLPQTLTNNTDTPRLPTRYHDVILYHALVYFAGHEEALSIRDDAYDHLQRWMNQIEIQQRPEIHIAAASIGL